MKHISLILAAAAASASLFAAEADEAEAAAPGGEAVAAASEAAQGSKAFFVLPWCKIKDGKAEIFVPGESDWRPVEEGRSYPLGTAYRTVGAGSRLVLRFGPASEVSIEGDASFCTRYQRLGENVRAINLVSGTVSVKLPNNLPEGLFTVNAPGFEAYNPAGESRYSYVPSVDGDEATVRCVTQTLSVRGRHFDITGMKAANEIRIRTSQDNLFTGIYGLSGDIDVKLDQGVVAVKDFTTGETKLEDKTLDWRLTPKTAVRIHRALPALGDKLAVAVMTFNARGELVNRCAFTEKTPEVNTGELGPTSIQDREALAKKAADMTDSAAEGDAASVSEAEAVEDDDAAPDAAPAASIDDDLDF